MHPLQAPPHRLRTRLVVSFPAHVAAQLGNHPHHLLELRRSLRRFLTLHHLVHRPPFRRVENPPRNRGPVTFGPVASGTTSASPRSGTPPSTGAAGPPPRTAASPRGSPT